MTGETWPFHEPTVRAIIARLEASKHRVHHGAAVIVANQFLPDKRVIEAEKIAAEKGWPVEAVIAGLMLKAEGAGVVPDRDDSKRDTCTEDSRDER